MSGVPSITDVQCDRACHADRLTGLLGWVSFVVDEAVRIDGVTVRLTTDGHVRLSFPEFNRGRGRRARPVRPLDDEVRREIERQVLDAIDLGTRGAL